MQGRVIAKSIESNGYLSQNANAAGNRLSVMISDSDIYRAANLLINLHDFDALVEAAKLLDVSLDRGDLEARAVWFRVKTAMEALEARSTGTVH